MWRFATLVPLLSACSKQVGEGDGVVDSDEAPGVGWEAEFDGRHHDLAGTAVVLDEHTIEIRDFTYDGGGINARLFVLADGADIDEAFETDSGNLVGDAFDNGTLTVTVPDEASFEDWNAITLWCIPASVSFGTGVFERP